MLSCTCNEDGLNSRESERWMIRAPIIIIRHVWKEITLESQCSRGCCSFRISQSSVCCSWSAVKKNDAFWMCRIELLLLFHSRSASDCSPGSRDALSLRERRERGRGRGRGREREGGEGERGRERERERGEGMGRGGGRERGREREREGGREGELVKS